MFFWQPAPAQVRALRITLGILSATFVPATLLAFRSYNILARALYKVAAVWLGLVNFLFLASIFCWLTFLLAALAAQIFPQAPSLQAVPHAIAPSIPNVLFGLAVVMAVYATINAAYPRMTRVSVKLPGLPDSWRGRTAALVTDTHLGHVRGRDFSARMVSLLQKEKPDIVFCSGDIFDGTKGDLARLVAPWKALRAPFGAYFVTGNHEEFTDPGKYTQAIAAAGISVLQSEKIIVDGLQIVGVRYADGTDEGHFQRLLERIPLDRTCASILLLHVPTRFPISEKHGISLQLSGHTHGGQVFPVSWIASRIWGKYVHGLNYFGAMAVYTSYGAGTWGPPLRFLTWPEIALIRFE
jgi:predicted MPP superfamily phosphohydrolase